MDLNYNFIVRKRMRKNGSVSYQLILSYRDREGNWKQKSKGGYSMRSLAASDKEKEKLLAEVRKVGDIDPINEGMTLEEFISVFLAGRRDLSYNTIAFYRRTEKLCGSLLRKPLTDITYADVYQRLQMLPHTEMVKVGWLRFLKMIFREAKKYRAVGASPIEDLTYRPRTDKAGGSRVRTFTAEEIQTILDYCYKRDLEAWVLLSIAAYTGARVGEILGLTMADIDFESMTITINKQLSLVEQGVISIKKLKSKHSYRTVPIPQALLRIIKRYDDFRLLYFHGRLTRFTSGGSLNYYLKSVYPNHSIHDFRHTYATKLLLEGLDIKTVASLLGDTIATVEKVYIHYTDEMRERAAGEIRRIFG